MPFTLVTGTMGGGKSLWAVEQAVKCFQEGGRVHSNLDWVDSELERLGWDKMHVKLADEPSEWVGQLIGGAEGAENMLIVDESAMIFHVRDQAETKKQNRALFDTLVMSRKLGLDVLFITQAYENVDVSLRRMANREINCIAIKRISWFGPMLVPLLGDFMRHELSGSKRRRLTTSYARFEPEIGALYKTDAVRGIASTVKQEATRKKSEVQTPPGYKRAMKIGTMAVLFGFAYLCFTIWQSSRSPAPAPVTVSPPLPSPAPAKDEPVFSFFGSGQKNVPDTTSALPKGSGRKLKFFAWADEDERIITCVIRGGPTGPRVHTLEGQVWTHDTAVEGGYVHTMVAHAGCYLVTMDDGRTFYLRPMTYGERMQIHLAKVNAANRDNQPEQNKPKWSNAYNTTSGLLGSAGEQVPPSNTGWNF